MRLIPVETAKLEDVGGAARLLFIMESQEEGKEKKDEESLEAIKSRLAFFTREVDEEGKTRLAEKAQD